MVNHKIAQEPPWRQGRCPFCYAKLGNVEMLKRKIRKVYKCKECGIVIDERFIIR